MDGDTGPKIKQSRGKNNQVAKITPPPPSTHTCSERERERLKGRENRNFKGETLANLISIYRY